MATTIMLLEKNAGLRTTLGRVLRHYGYIVQAYAHPFSFLASQPQTTPAIYLVDYESISRLVLDNRLLGSTPPRTCVIMTVRLISWRELKRDYPQLPVLIKPFGLRELLDILINIKTF